MPHFLATVAVLAGVATAQLSVAVSGARTFEIANDTFFKDGEPYQVRAGCIHYSRVPEEYWLDRLERLRSMGLNAVQTYVPWNWHNPSKGVFDFHSSGRNLTKFVAIAQDVGK